MNIPASAERGQSGPHDPGREKEWGGEYGPYVMSRYTTIEGSRCTLYYTMSTWNPYQVVVMRSDLALESARIPDGNRRQAGGVW
jgi:hypothetical protein